MVLVTGNSQINNQAAEGIGLVDSREVSVAVLMLEPSFLMANQLGRLSGMIRMPPKNHRGKNKTQSARLPEPV